MMPLKEGKTGLSKFCGLYPRHIKTFDHIPNTVCLCTYHENLLTNSCGCSWVYQLTINLQLFCWSINDQVTCDEPRKEYI